LDSWRAYRDVRFLWVGNFFANTAHWLQLLSTGWLVRDLTDSFASSGLLVVGRLVDLTTVVLAPKVVGVAGLILSSISYMFLHRVRQAN